MPFAFSTSRYRKRFSRDKLIQIFTWAVNNDNFFLFNVVFRNGYFSQSYLVQPTIVNLTISTSPINLSYSPLLSTSPINLSFYTSPCIYIYRVVIHGAKRLFDSFVYSHCCIKTTSFRCNGIVRFRGFLISKPNNSINAVIWTQTGPLSFCYT